MAAITNLLIYSIFLFETLASSVLIDNGDTLTLTPGVSLEVKLESSPTTGYEWYAGEIVDPNFTVKDTGYHPYKALPGMVGTDGYQTFNLEAKQECIDRESTSLTFNYQRIWEPNPIKQITVTLLCGISQEEPAYQTIY